MADPTVADVFNQLVLVNGKLDQIDTNTFGQANAINNLAAEVSSGFTNNVNALNTLALINTELTKLVFHITQQNETIICALEQISRNTCAIHAEADRQTRLQTAMAADLDVIRDISECAHPDCALDRKRREALDKKIERCCPTEEPRPACKYQPCPKPREAREPDLPRVDPQPRPEG
jgi:hypothetical protein